MEDGATDILCFMSFYDVERTFQHRLVAVLYWRGTLEHPKSFDLLPRNKKKSWRQFRSYSKGGNLRQLYCLLFFNLLFTHIIRPKGSYWG